MTLKTLSRLLTVTAVASALASSALATQTIHFDQDFTDNSTAAEVGSLNNVDPALILQFQNSWRNTSLTYFGVAQADAFDDAGGFGTAKQFRMSTVNNAILQAGNVWILDMSIISDMATTGSQFFSGSPGPVVEWDWLTPANFSFTSSAISKLSPAVSSVGGDSGSILNAAYPNGADSNVEPTALGTSLSGAGLASALDGTLRAKYAWQGIAGGFTRASAQALLNNTVVGSAGHNDGGAGSFRSDYTGGFFAQMMGGHGGGNVTYSAGHGGGTDVAFVAGDHENLEIGLTRLTFKQVAAGDNTADGNVDINDASNLIGNWLGTGKNFFQGDTDGDADVDADDASVLLGDWTASPIEPLSVESFEASVPLGTGKALYDPANGHVLLDVNKVALWRLDSATDQFIGSPTDLGGGRWTITGTTKQADAGTIAEFTTSNTIVFNNTFNIGTFMWDYTNVPGDLGQLLPTGLSDMTGLTFSYQTLGNDPITIPLEIVPEPTTVLLTLVGVAMFGLIRRKS